MEFLTQLLSTAWLNVLDFLPRGLGAALILFAFIVLGRFLSKAFSVVLRKFSGVQIHDAFFRSLIRLVLLYFGIVLALNVLGLERLSLSILAGGGVTAIVLGFAFREIGENFLAGIFLAFSRPFNVGDLINSEGLEGRIRAIELRYTHLRSDDGQDIYVPSSQLFSKPVINYTRDGLRRYQFKVGIDYSNDSKACCTLLLETVSGIEGVLKKPAAGVTINSLEPQFVEIQVFYWRNLFDTSIDGRQLRILVIDACRKALLENGYTVSADTTSNIAVSGTVNSGC